MSARIERVAVRRFAWLTLKWVLWAEIIGPLVVATVAIPMISILETNRASLSPAGVVVGAIAFAGWGVGAFVVRAPAVLFSAATLSTAAHLKSGIESSVLASGLMMVVVGCVAAEIGFEFVSGGGGGDVPRASWFVWVLSYLIGPRIFVKSLRPGAFEAANRRSAPGPCRPARRVQVQ